MKVELKTITPDIELFIVEIARVSSSREDKRAKPEGLINYLINHQHWSPFEHGYITFEINTSKAIGIQLLRHRSFTFQELSQRYAIVEDFEPIELRKQAEDNRQSSTEIINPAMWKSESGMDINYHQRALSVIKQHTHATKEIYDELLRAGVARECARMILPMCTSTKIFMTGNVRSWIHFLNLRDDEHAQKEIQDVAKEIKKILIKELPIISKALSWI